MVYLSGWSKGSLYCRAVGSFLWWGGGGLSKNVGHHGWLTMKNKKKETLAKTP